MAYQVKIGDPVTYCEEGHWLKGKRAFIYDIIPLDKLDKKYGDWNIVLEFIDTKTKIGIRNLGSYDYPEREHGRIHCSRTDFVLGHAPLTRMEIFEKELDQFKNKPWIQLFNCPDRSDHKCIVSECQNYVSTHIWINCNGTGFRYPVCLEHADQYNLCSCREDIPFKTKPDEVLEKVV